MINNGVTTRCHNANSPPTIICLGLRPWCYINDPSERHVREWVPVFDQTRRDNLAIPYSRKQCASHCSSAGVEGKISGGCGSEVEIDEAEHVDDHAYPNWRIDSPSDSSLNPPTTPTTRLIDSCPDPKTCDCIIDIIDSRPDPRTFTPPLYLFCCEHIFERDVSPEHRFPNRFQSRQRMHFHGATTEARADSKCSLMCKTDLTDSLPQCNRVNDGQVAQLSLRGIKEPILASVG